MPETGYVFDTADDADRRRLTAQSAVWDPFTFRRLREVGVGTGWRCLEVGAGTGSVASWLRQQVGDTGHVVATDIETKWLEPLAAANLEVRRHDVVADPLDDAEFDLIHVRLVLMHLPQRDAVLAKLTGALRHGGWLVVDDYDLHTITVAHPPHAAWTRVSRAVPVVLESAGADVSYGGRLPTVLREAGLTDVDAEGMVIPRRFPELASFLLPALERIQDRIIDSGLATAAELAAVIDEFRDQNSSLWTFSPILVSAQGRRG